MLVDIFERVGYKADLETGKIYGLRGQELIPCKTSNGYYTVTIQNKRQKVHRLILMTATQSNGKGLQVNHKDGNKANNSISNLEWVTAKQNTIHAEFFKLRTHNQTKVRRDRKLIDDEVLLIKRLIVQGKTTKEIKLVCPNANSKNVYAIKNNRNYRAVKDNTELTQ